MDGRPAAFRLALVTPVLNDWESLTILLRRIVELYDRSNMEFSVVVVDDGSTQESGRLDLAVGEESCIRHFEVIRLATNLGHQRAIAIGLVSQADRTDIDAVLVMDSDGEDRPEEIGALVEAARTRPDTMILAERSKRSESMTFKLGYLFYKLLFWLLTGQRVSSGNFSIIPMAAVRGLTHIATLWNNLPATLIRSRYRRCSVPTIRGQRYAGQSKMNLVSLVTHGLSGISVYVDVIFVRLLIAAAGLMVLAVAAIVFIICYKLFTNLATPGWATTVISTFLIIMLQAGIFVIGITLMLLGGRSNYTVVPALDWQRYVDQRSNAWRSANNQAAVQAKAGD